MLFSVLKRLAALFVCCCIALGACSVFAEESWTCHLCGFEACSNYCANCGAKKREQALDVFYETALKESRRLVEFCGVESLAKLYTNSEEVLALVRSFADERWRQARNISRSFWISFRDTT